MEPQADTPSARIRDLRLVRRIATGAIGEVFLAEREGGDPSPPLVVKRLRLRPGGGGALAEAFNAAAHLYGRLGSAAVVRLIDSFWDSGVPILVLERVEGLSLQRVRSILKTHGEQLDDRVSLSIGLRVFEALSYAHGLVDPATEERTPLVHGAVDPSCVLAAWSGELKMGGFGIPDEVRRQAEGGGAGPGTHGYLAPEQLKGEPASARADVYAASLLLWELLARRKPIPRGTLAEIEVLRAMAEPSLFALDALRPDLPKRLREAVSRGLEAHPERRTITAEQLASVMREALGPDQETVLAATMARVQANAERRPSSLPPPPAFPRERRSRQSGFISRPDLSEVSGTAPPPARRSVPSAAPSARPSSPSFSLPPPSVGRVGETTVPVSVPTVPRTLMPPPTLRTADHGGTPSSRRHLPEVGALAPLPRFDRAEPPVVAPSAPSSPAPSLRESAADANRRASAAPSAAPLGLSRPPERSTEPFPPDSRSRRTDPPKSFAAPEVISEPPSAAPRRSLRPSVPAPSGSPESQSRYGVARGPRHVSWLLLAGIVIVASGAVVAGLFVAQKPAVPGAGRGVAARSHAVESEPATPPPPAAPEAPASPPVEEAAKRPEATSGPAPSAVPAPVPPPVPVESLATAAPRPASAVAPAPPAPGAAAPSPPDGNTGDVIPPARAAGHRIFVDGRVAGEGTQPLRVRCGPRHIQIGSAGAPMVVDVPCGGEVSLTP